MSRSKIIKDLANSSIDTLTGLKRIKVLLNELGDKELSDWVTYEISGYPNEVELPKYRLTAGILKESYFKGSMASRMTWNNVSLPLGNMPDDVRTLLLTIQFREGVGTLKQLMDGAENGMLEKPVTADFFPIISGYNNDPYMIITSAKVVFGSQEIQNVFSALEDKMLDVLLKLEKEFGNLDDLDIDTSSKNKDEMSQIAQDIHVIIYNDSSISVGDHNQINDSPVGSTVNS